MKKLIALFFILVFLFNSMGYFVVFQLEQFAAREEMRSNIDLGVFDSRITVLSINNTLLSNTNSSFQKFGNEFIYNGQLYDIVKSENKGNETVFYVLNDQKEEHLFASLENHFQSHQEGTTDSKHPAPNKKLGKNLVKAYFFQNIAVLAFNLRENSNTPSFVSFYQSIDKKAPLLPPKLA